VKAGSDEWWKCSAVTYTEENLFRCALASSDSCSDANAGILVVDVRRCGQCSADSEL